MNIEVKNIIWNQFGAAIDMLGNAIDASPENVWGNQIGDKEFWYLTYHTLIWLDFYLSDSVDSFQPHPPFTLSEFDPEGLLPDRVYTKDELNNYLNYCRNKCNKTILELTDERANKRFVFNKINFPFLELLFYNMCHVQHHAAQLKLLLRQKIDSAPRWVKQSIH